MYRITPQPLRRSCDQIETNSEGNGHEMFTAVVHGAKALTTQQSGLSREGAVRPRRVAVFVGNYADVVDGVSRTTRRLVADLRERGDEVQVFAPCGPRPAMSTDPRQQYLPSIPLFGFGQAGYRYALGLGTKGREVLERFAPDLIHVASPDRASQQAMRWGRAHGVPLVGSFHTNFASYFRYLWPWRWMEGVVWRFTTRFYNAFDRVLVPTASMLQELREHGMSTPASIWSRGVDLQRLRPTRRDARWGRSLGLTRGEVVGTLAATLCGANGLRPCCARPPSPSSPPQSSPASCSLPTRYGKHSMHGK